MLLAFKLLIFLGSACVFLFHTLSNITTALFFVKEFSIFFLTLDFFASSVVFPLPTHHNLKTYRQTFLSSFRRVPELRQKTHLQIVSNVCPQKL